MRRVPASRHHGWYRHRGRLRLEVERGRPWYYDVQLPPHLDLVHLRPVKLNKKGRNRGFEAVQDCIKRDREHIVVLGARGSSRKSQQLAAKLYHCVRGAPCGSSASKTCMRELRRALTGLALPHAHQYHGDGLLPVLLTVVWTDPELRSPDLPDITLANLEQRFRMLLRRCNLNHVPMIGGVEIDFNDTAQVWEPHGHFVAFLKHRKELKPLKRHFKKARGVSRPFQVKPRDPDRLHEVIAYCWKFAPMKKVRYRRWNEDRQKWKFVTRKVKLSNAQLRQALIWLDDRDPTEFLFFQGLKLLGSKLIKN